MLLKFGDAVHSVLHPIAERIIDPTFGTDFANCQSCAERRRALNAMSDFLSKTQTQRKENPMTFQMTVLVEGEDIRDAINKVKLDGGQIISIMPKPVAVAPINRPEPVVK
jgi:hypothetical protein